MILTDTQTAVIHARSTSFLLGAAGTGKTTALQQRLLRLLADGEPAYTLLVLVAEPEQQQTFLNALDLTTIGSISELKITTYNKMAQEMVRLFWPLVARSAGFARPYQPPAFLSYDLAQLLMWQVIQPLRDDGLFADLRLRPQQIVSQLLDTLNRAALNGLSLDEAIERQQRTWVGDPAHLVHLAGAGQAARAFRQRCLENSLLDLSLAVQVFDTQLVKHPDFQNYFSERFRHLLVDNIEEQTPAGQNFVAQLMDATLTTTIAYDDGGGYKRFLAADPMGATQFANQADEQFLFNDNFVTTQPLIQLANLTENFLERTTKPTAGAAEAIGQTVNGRYRREMVAALVKHLAAEVAAGTETQEMAIITPYLDGALLYMLTNALREAKLPYRLLRRRSSPREEPRVRSWLTWLALAHPEWGMPPPAYDVAEALTLSIADLDAARATLIANALYDGKMLLSLDEMPDAIAARLDEFVLERVAEIRAWLLAANGRFAIDTFLYTLFNDLLAQPRFQPTPDLAGAAICDWLVTAATRLRRAATALNLPDDVAIGRAFLDGIQQGLVTANPPDLGDPPDPNGITIATIYGYLLAGNPVQIQVWLETAATGWWDIPNQPLSNAFVLAQSYDPSQPWTTEQDFAIRNQLLSRIVQGLTNRCKGHVVLANSDLDRRGVQQEGMLWKALAEARRPLSRE